MRSLQIPTETPGTEGVHDDQLIVAVSRDELMGLSNGLNEALSAVEEWEFHSRMGILPGEAKSLINDIQGMLRDAPMRE